MESYPRPLSKERVKLSLFFLHKLKPLQRRQAIADTETIPITNTATTMPATDPLLKPPLLVLRGFIWAWYSAKELKNQTNTL